VRARLLRIRHLIARALLALARRLEPEAVSPAPPTALPTRTLRARRGDASRFIFEMSEGDSITARAFCIEVGCSDTTARRHLNAAVQGGVLEFDEQLQRYTRRGSAPVDPAPFAPAKGKDDIPF